MKYANILKASASASILAIIAGLPVDSNGYFLSEEQMTNVDAALAANEGSIASLTTERDNQALLAQQATTDLATANETITTRDARIAELEAEVATLKAGPAGEMKNPVTDVDPVAEKKTDGRLDKYRTIYDNIAGY